jgi:phage gp29-like protein
MAKRLPQFAGLNRKARRAASGLGAGFDIKAPVSPEPDKDVLGREISAPMLGGIRNVISAHPAQGLTPERLVSILRSAENYNADLYFDVAEDMEERDTQYASVMGTRKRAVSQLPITIESVDDSEAEEAKAQFLRDYFERPTVEDEVYDILDALGKGISYTEIVWDTAGKYWLPKALKTRHPRWFRFDMADGETPLLKADDGTFQPLPANKFIVHTPKLKTGIPVRGGLARLISWTYLFKNYALKDWVIFAEVYGLPVRVGKYGPSATDADRRKLLQAVQSIGTDAAAIIPASMMIEFVSGMQAGNYEVFEKLCTYLDQQMSKAVLGQTSTTDAVAGGLGGSQANVHNDVRADIQRADAKQLAATLQRDLVKPMMDFNFGVPADGNYPKLKIGQAEAWTKDQMAMVESFISMGGEVEQSVIRDKLGLPDPPEKTADGQPPKLLKPSAMTTPKNGETGVRPVEASHTAASAFQGLLRGLKRHLSPAGRQTPPSQDAIDAAIDEMAASAHWTDITDPMIELLEETVAAATSPDDLRGRLLDLANMDQSELTTLLARSTFAARLAAETGLSLKDGGQ